MSKSTYIIKTTEADGDSEIHLEHHEGQPNATIYEMYSDGEDRMKAVGAVVVSLDELARFGRVAAAIKDGREPSKKNYDQKDVTTA